MTNKSYILIVEKNPFVANVLFQTLRTDFHITIATTGNEAARLLIQGNRFDCVVTEVNLPFFSGLELTELIRTNRLTMHIPILVLSTANDSYTRIKYLQQGIDSYIAKPFNPLEVKAKLHALIRRSTALRKDNQLYKTHIKLHKNSNPFVMIKSRISPIISKPKSTTYNASGNHAIRLLKSCIISLIQRNYA